jgi:MFS transporter, UMF1 family
MGVMHCNLKPNCEGLGALPRNATECEPFLVGIVTAALASQKAGMAVLIAFFAAGALLLAQVRSPS